VPGDPGRELGRHSAVILVSLAQLAAIMTGGIDLSVGSVVAVSVVTRPSSPGSHRPCSW
jgi:ribose/xylose/arabinose/galactoside ABC-type transport system permease subunit